MSDKIQQKLEQQNLSLINRINERKEIIKNKTIIDLAIKYIEAQGCRYDIIAQINQVRLHKLIMIPCKLADFQERRKTKEVRQLEIRSNVL